MREATGMTRPHTLTPKVVPTQHVTFDSVGGTVGDTSKTGTLASFNDFLPTRRVRAAPRRAPKRRAAKRPTKRAPSPRTARAKTRAHVRKRR